MKKQSLYDRANAATFRAISPEWGKVRKARKAATTFVNPEVDIPTESVSYTHLTLPTICSV